VTVVAVVAVVAAGFSVQNIYLKTTISAVCEPLGE